MALAFIIAALALLYFYLSKKLSYWKQLGVPQNEQWNPLGDIWDVGFKYHFLEKNTMMYNQFKPISKYFGFYNLTTPSLFLTDLELCKAVMVKDFNHFVNRSMYFSEEADPLSCHMFSIEGEKWRRIRNSLSPTFTSGKIKMMFPIIEEKSRDFVGFLSKFAESGEPVGLKDANTRFTADIIASAAFGLETKSLQIEKPVILSVLSKIFESHAGTLFYFMFVNTFPSVARFLKLRLFDKEIEDFFARTITETIEHRKKNQVERSDFMNMLINLKERGTISDTGEANEEGKLTFNEILAQAFLFFVAGYETSSTAMAYSLYFLAKHPDVQEKLRLEIKQTRQKHDGKVNYDAVMEMTYLNQVFNESMRLYPPVGFLFRRCTQDYTLPGTDLTVKKGTDVNIPVYSIHRDPEYFPNPDKFDPERFRPEEVAKRHPFAFIPFGDGPRNCIGMRFAQLQAKYGILAAVENFVLSVSPKTQEPLKLDKSNPNTNVVGGLWLDFKKI